MDATNRRPWENNPSSSPTSHPQNQTLPSISTLTHEVDSRSIKKEPLSATLNPPRDSGSWSNHGIVTGSQANGSMPYLNSSTHPSPPGPYTPDTSNPKTPTFPDFKRTSQFSNKSGTDNRGSGDFDDSRRESMDSRIHQGMKNMDLGPASPYNASANASQSSLAQGLQRERGIHANGYRGPRTSAGSGGPISPMWPRSGDRSFVPGRVAPPILENPRSEVYLAEAPTRGQAYAFPDPDARPGRPPSNFSRRSSFAESFASSVLSNGSRLPPGQHELPGDAHHHSLQHRQVESLRGDPESPNSTTPYSRTPELRVTHKLAERKRRSEMKDCFEQLRVKLPSNQNNKSSKWETLARAIDYITSLENTIKAQGTEIDKKNRQLQEMEMQIKELHMHRPQQNGYSQQGTVSSNGHGYSQHYPPNGIDTSHEPPRTLPPIMNGAMQGVQYSDERR